MTLEITVRGSAEKRFAPDVAIVSLGAVREGTDREQVFREAVAIQDPLRAQLTELQERGAVATWSSDQVRVHSHRPWDEHGRQGDVVQVARVDVSAEFTDFDRLSGFVDYWAGRDGVEIGGVQWDVLPKNRRIHESEVRRLAVDAAVTKAQAYADAVRRGRVTALHLSDPGMLDLGGGGPQPMMALAGRAERDVQPALMLVPEHIVIRVEVDAKFAAG